MGTVILIVLAVMVIAVIGVSIMYYNRLQRYNIHVDNVFANLDAILMRRVDQLTNMADTIKEQVKDEKDVLEGVIGLRQQIIDAPNVDEKVKAHNNMNKEVPALMSTFERYPDVKFSESYKTMMRAIADVEENIQAGRHTFNHSVGRFNSEVSTFPGNIFAGIFRFGPRQMFEAPPEKRENVDMKSIFGR